MEDEENRVHYLKEGKILPWVLSKDQRRDYIHGIPGFIFFCGFVLKQSIMAGSVVKLPTSWWLMAEHHGGRECGKTTHLVMTEGEREPCQY